MSRQITEIAPPEPQGYLALLDSLGIKFVSKATASNKVTTAASVAGSAVITEGSRNERLTSIAGSMRARNATEEQILEQLRKANSEHCNPPLDDAEVVRIAASVSRYAPSPLASDQARSLNDVGNARRLIERFGGRLRYVVEHKGWLYWNDTRWASDEVGGVFELAKEVARGIYYEAAEATHDDLRKKISKHADDSHGSRSISAMVKLATTDPRVVVHASELDNHDELLGVANGVVDLRTGLLRAARREDLITKHSPIAYDPRARCPTWLRFLKRATNNDRELMRYLQRMVGYAISGLTTEQVLFFLYGSGANGKTTFIKAMEAVLGPDLACQLPYDSLVQRKQPRSSTNDLARLQGARAVFTAEVEDGTFLAESLVKQLTGSDTITARHLYQKFVDFEPKFKLFIAGNHKPIIKGDDNGIWRRLHLVPFVVTIPATERDPRLLGKLRAEAPGILAWAVRGGVRWQRLGLSPPPIITDAVKEYREEMDLIGEWIKEKCNVGPNLTLKASEGYQDYRFWAMNNGYQAMSNARFGRKLSERFQKQPSRRGIDYLGIELA